MNDLYHHLEQNKSRKVSPRTNDGFADSTIVNNAPLNAQITDSDKGATSNNNQSPLLDTTVSPSPPPSNPHQEPSEYLVETSKSKLLTVEVQLRQQLDQILYEHSEISWDTLIEAALITCLEHQNTRKKVLKLAAQRLAARKQSAVYKRTLTMSQKYF